MCEGRDVHLSLATPSTTTATHITFEIKAFDREKLLRRVRQIVRGEEQWQ